jgi:hypothetical protein
MRKQKLPPNWDGRMQGRGRPRKMSRLATLSDLGITRDQSSKWQKIAQIPEDVFEELMESPDFKPTTNALVRIARQYEHPDEPIPRAELLARVDQFRAKHGFRSRAGAIRWLLDQGIDASRFLRGTRTIVEVVFMILKHDEKAWEEGFKAGEGREPRCPYPAGTTQAWSWQSGYVEGDAKRQGYSYSRGASPKEPPPRKGL